MFVTFLLRWILYPVWKLVHFTLLPATHSVFFYFQVWYELLAAVQQIWNKVIFSVKCNIQLLFVIWRMEIGKMGSKLRRRVHLAPRQKYTLCSATLSPFQSDPKTTYKLSFHNNILVSTDFLDKQAQSNTKLSKVNNKRHFYFGIKSYYGASKSVNII